MAELNLKIRETNKARITGTITGLPVPETEVYAPEKGYWRFEVSCRRKSGTPDRIPVIASPEVFGKFKGNYEKGARIRLAGKFRSANKNSADGKRHLILYFCPDSIFPAEEEQDNNYLEMFCTICKPPAYRFTPLGRDITDVLLAVNWKDNAWSKAKSAYIPSICWGDAALEVSGYPVGTCLQTKGYLQSREYTKDGVVHTAMEYSIYSVQTVESCFTLPTQP